MLANFDGTNGIEPTGHLAEDGSGNLFGTTEFGGANRYGTIYEWVKSTGAITVLANFDATYGLGPTGLVLDGNGNLFGTTTDLAGGAGGILFEWVKATDTVSMLADSAYTFGFHLGLAFGGLIEDASGNLFGTAEYIGGGGGLLYERVATTGAFSVLSTISANTGSPFGTLAEDADGNLYGITESGGTNDVGSLFEWASSTGTVSILDSFDVSSRWSSVSIDQSGNLLGVSANGGSGYGAVFEWLTTTGAMTTLVSFDSLDGDGPIGPLVEDSAGDLFGPTVLGGGNGNLGGGIIFELVNAPTTQLAFTPPLPAIEPLGQTVNVQVSAETSGGIVNAAFTGTVALKLPSGSTLTQAAQRGIATFSVPALTAGTNTLQATTGGLTPASASFIAAYTPNQIRHAYGFDAIPFLENNKTPDATTYNANAGAGQTIAIVIDGDDPSLFNDVQTFNTQFGLPQFGGTNAPNLAVYNEAATEAILNGQVLSANGSSVPLPPAASSTDEESLDVQWAHAIAPAANIDVVEVNSPSGPIAFDLLNGAKVAGTLPGVSVVSMSWGAIGAKGDSEDPHEMTFDSNVVAPGVTYVNASGDDGANNFGYPSASPNVLTVGGTSLQHLNSNGNYPGTSKLGEIGWSGSGGGISLYEPSPLYQVAFGVPGKGNRAVPDAAFDADSATGVFIYGSASINGGSQWFDEGGTSLGAPCWAALMAIVDQGRVAAGTGKTTLTGFNQTLPALYGIAATTPGAFHDIIFGNNGSNGTFNAAGGYDLVTGLGTPVANVLVPALIGYNALVVKSATTLSGPILEGVPTASLLLATFTQAAGTQSASAYSATVTWGDGTTDKTTETHSPLSIVVTGQNIRVFGTHAFISNGTLTVGIAISGPRGAAATAYSTADVATDASGQTSVSRSGLTYNRSTKQFYGTLAITNTGSANLNGSLDVLLQGLTSGVSLAYASMTIGSVTYNLTITQDASGDPYIHVPQSVLSSLATGQSLLLAVRFSNPSLGLIGFTPRAIAP